MSEEKRKIEIENLDDNADSVQKEEQNTARDAIVIENLDETGEIPVGVITEALENRATQDQEDVREERFRFLRQKRKNMRKKRSCLRFNSRIWMRRNSPPNRNLMRRILTLKLFRSLQGQRPLRVQSRRQLLHPQSIVREDVRQRFAMQKGADWRMIREEHSVRPTMNTEESRKTVRTTRRAATLPAGRKRRVRGRS